MLFLAGPVIGVLTFVAAVLLGGVSFESDAPRSSAQYLALLILVGWAVLSYYAARYAGLRRQAACIAAMLAVGWSLGSWLLVVTLA
jgi:hypothetical protein